MKNGMITGASDGIGLEAAKLLAASGITLTLVARNKEKLEKVISNLPGQRHTYLVADLTRVEDTGSIADHLAKNHYDFLINNAGVGIYGKFDEISLDSQLEMMQLNMNAVVVLAHAYLTHAQRGDALVNTALVLAISSMPGAAVYASTKAFMLILSESLWHEFKKQGVYVLGFCPGVTSSKFHVASGGSNEMFPAAMTQTPQQTASEMVRALMNRSQPRFVSGAINRMTVFTQRLLSRKAAVNMMGMFSPMK